MMKRAMAMAVCLVTAAYGGAAICGEGGANSTDVQKLLAGGGDKDLNLDDVDKINDYAERLKKLDEVEGFLKSIEQKREDRNKLKNGEGYFGGAEGVPGAGVPPGASAPSSGYAVDHLDGAEGVYTAVLIDSSGRRMAVSAGTSLGGDNKVESISFKSGVTVVDGRGRKHPLPFAAQKQDSSTGTLRQGGGY